MSKQGSGLSQRMALTLQRKPLSFLIEELCYGYYGALCLSGHTKGTNGRVLIEALNHARESLVANVYVVRLADMDNHRQEESTEFVGAAIIEVSVQHFINQLLIPGEDVTCKVKPVYADDQVNGFLITFFKVETQRVAGPVSTAAEGSLAQVLEASEKAYLEALMTQQDWDLTKASAIAGIHRRYLREKLTKHGLAKPK